MSNDDDELARARIQIRKLILNQGYVLEVFPTGKCWDAEGNEVPMPEDLRILFHRNLRRAMTPMTRARPK
jgi:hypothetical protein